MTTFFTLFSWLKYSKLFHLFIVFGTISIVSFVVSPTETAYCSPAGCPEPSVQGQQPSPQELIVQFDKAGTNRLGNNGPSLPRINAGYPQFQPIDPYVPCILLKAIGWTESTGWKQFNANYGQTGSTIISFDCGYGIMQITSGMGGGSGFDPARVAADPTYNIGTGAQNLITKWNSISQSIGDNNPYVVEDWYYAVWAYNSFSNINNPNNSQYPINRSPWQCDNNSSTRSDYPYQELVWGCAANPPNDPTLPNKKLWVATPLTLPQRSLITNPPPAHIDTPLPSHRSCSATYIPLLLKDYPPCYQRINNSSFESNLVSWNEIGSVVASSQYASTGTKSAWLGGYNNGNDELYQSIYVPTIGPTGKPVSFVSLNYSWYITTQETVLTTVYDTLDVKVLDQAGNSLGNLQTLSNLSTKNRWRSSSFDLTPFKGQSIRIYFQAKTDSDLPTSFYLDDVLLYACE